MPDFDANFLKNLLFAVGGLIWTALGIKHLLLKPDAPIPTPLVTDRVKVYASKVDHDQLAAKVDRNHESTEQRFREMAYASSQSRDKIYIKLNAVSEELAAQRKADEMTQATLARIDIKLDALNQRKADK